MNLLNMMILSVSITTMMMILSKTMKEEKSMKKEKSCNFECGFNFQMSKNNMFSGQFFMICILFIIFDMEIIMLLPFLKEEQYGMKKTWLLMIIIIFLIMSTILEWKTGMIEWVK